MDGTRAQNQDFARLTKSAVTARHTITSDYTMRLSRARVNLRMRSTLSRHGCVHITYATRVDTGQPGIAKRAGLARFGSDCIAFTLEVTRVNPG